MELPRHDYRIRSIISRKLTNLFHVCCRPQSQGNPNGAPFMVLRQSTKRRNSFPASLQNQEFSTRRLRRRPIVSARSSTLTARTRKKQISFPCPKCSDRIVVGADGCIRTGRRLVIAQVPFDPTLSDGLAERLNRKAARNGDASVVPFYGGDPRRLHRHSGTFVAHSPLLCHSFAPAFRRTSITS